jgi:pyrimidine operon attenuation protein / uracil phosphoribosyltransferase
MNIPNIEEIYAELLADLSTALKEYSPEQTAAVRLVGIHTGGAWLAERLHADLHLPEQPGFLSSAFHRDDFSQRGLPSEIKSTDIPFDIDGAHIILVDDILFTGRTVRAALNEIFDYGRPASVELAVLLDRGGRHLPIEPGFCGAYIALSDQQQFVLSRTGAGSTMRFDLKLEGDS